MIIYYNITFNIRLNLKFFVNVKCKTAHFFNKNIYFFYIPKYISVRKLKR